MYALHTVSCSQQHYAYLKLFTNCRSHMYDLLTASADMSNMMACHAHEVLLGSALFFHGVQQAYVMR
jgi:hypothetical protein